MVRSVFVPADELNYCRWEWVTAKRTLGIMRGNLDAKRGRLASKHKEPESPLGTIFGFCFNGQVFGTIHTHEKEFVLTMRGALGENDPR